MLRKIAETERRTYIAVFESELAKPKHKFAGIAIKETDDYLAILKQEKDHFAQDPERKALDQEKVKRRSSCIPVSFADLCLHCRPHELCGNIGVITRLQKETKLNGQQVAVKKIIKQERDSES